MFVSAVQNYHDSVKFVAKSGFKTPKTIVSQRNIESRQPLCNISFYGIQKDFLSVYEFQKVAKECGIKSLKDLTENIKPENMLGVGANSKVYRFTDKHLDNWALKVDKKPFNKISNALFTPSFDTFYGHNMGQEIAKSGDRYRILKKVHGIPHSVNNWSGKISSGGVFTHEEACEFLNSLDTIQNFPQKSFDKYAQDLKLLQDKGFKQDSINPNNILIDYNKKIIHIIDFFKVADSSHINSRLDLSCVLLDFSLFKNIHENLNTQEQQKLTECSKKIIEKCNIASKKAGLKQDEKIFIDFLTNVDKWFGCHLVDKGGDYRTRYANMNNILNKSNR